MKRNRNKKAERAARIAAVINKSIRKLTLGQRRTLNVLGILSAREAGLRKEWTDADRYSTRWHAR